FAAFADELRARILDVSVLAAARPLEREKERIARLETPLSRAFGGAGAGTISQRTIRGLLATPGVDSVLVGMRRTRYVDDVVGTFA
ncbi:MAG TPA: hypothetical protein VGR00_02020, partial [Thermoanaerobaculia bacterium]|nr:hypothetical protein [Thermoanaerobaculia bacterium]